MSDLISRSALLDEINGIYKRHYEKSSYQFIHDFFRAMFRKVNKSPTIDAVPVVRCKDCGFGTLYLSASGIEYVDCANDDYAVRKPDDFCSYGERKADA